MKFGRTETKDAVSSETSHGVSNSIIPDCMHTNNVPYSQRTESTNCIFSIVP